MVWIWIVGLILNTVWMMFNFIKMGSSPSDPRARERDIKQTKMSFILFLFFSVMLLLNGVVYLLIIGLDLSVAITLLIIFFAYEEGEFNWYVILNFLITILFAILTIHFF
jgi:hypothetical protein